MKNKSVLPTLVSKASPTQMERIRSYLSLNRFLQKRRETENRHRIQEPLNFTALMKKQTERWTLLKTQTIDSFRNRRAEMHGTLSESVRKQRERAYQRTFGRVRQAVDNRTVKVTNSWRSLWRMVREQVPGKGIRSQLRRTRKSVFRLALAVVFVYAAGKASKLRFPRLFVHACYD